MLDKLKRSIEHLRKQKPLVLCLTNFVTMDLMANCLLSIGAAPIMTQYIDELEELVKISSSVNVNIGTLDQEFIERARLAVEFACKFNKPIILDPVGSGASQIRTNASRDLLKSSQIIRGNASEIISLFEDTNKTLGVEATHQVDDALSVAQKLAKTHRCTVIVSGVQDYITDGTREVRLGFGSELMPLVTGMGCALTAIVAAFACVTEDAFEAGVLGTAYFSLAGSIAAQKASAPGSFRMCFVDELHKANFEAMNMLINQQKVHA